MLEQIYFKPYIRIATPIKSGASGSIIFRQRQIKNEKLYVFLKLS